MSQVNAHAAGTSARTSRQRWYALAVCMAGGFIVFLDVSIVNVALPTISRQLRASGSLLQWIVAGYSLAFGLVLVPAGRLGDIMGHRMLFTTGLGAFVAASAVCGAAPTAAVLVAARIAQGAAGSILNPQISATIQQLFQGAERGKAFGYFASVVSVASAIGPLAGGALIAAFGVHAGWRAVFYVNVPIGLALIPLAVKLLPRHVRAPGRRPGLDLPGAGLLGLGIALILLPFIQGGWGAWRWWLLAGAAAVLTAFLWREQRAADPVRRRACGGSHARGWSNAGSSAARCRTGLQRGDARTGCGSEGGQAGVGERGCRHQRAGTSPTARIRPVRDQSFLDRKGRHATRDSPSPTERARRSIAFQQH